MSGREYIKARKVRMFEDEANGLDSLARTVYEEYDLVDTGVVDAGGDPIMARKKMDPIGYMRFKPCGDLKP